MTTPNPTQSATAAAYTALDTAGGRCQCRGDCGNPHVLDDGGGQCPVLDHWPDDCDLDVTPADPRRDRDDRTALPVGQLRVRCSTCWREAHQLAREQSTQHPTGHYPTVAA